MWWRAPYTTTQHQALLLPNGRRDGEVKEKSRTMTFMLWWKHVCACINSEPEKEEESIQLLSLSGWITTNLLCINLSSSVLRYIGVLNWGLANLYLYRDRRSYELLKDCSPQERSYAKDMSSRGGVESNWTNFELIFIEFFELFFTFESIES